MRYPEPLSGSYPEEVTRMLAQGCGYQPINCGGLIMLSKERGGMVMFEIDKVRHMLQIFETFSTLIENTVERFGPSEEPPKIGAWFWLESTEVDDDALVKGVDATIDGFILLDTILQSRGGSVNGLCIIGVEKGTWQTNGSGDVWQEWDLTNHPWRPRGNLSVQEMHDEQEAFWGIVGEGVSADD